jgi:hypothetical protein
MNRGSDSLWITSNTGFQPALRGYKAEKDSQLSEGNGRHIWSPLSFPMIQAFTSQMQLGIVCA